MLEEVSYGAVHARARAQLPEVCARCGATEHLDAALRHDALPEHLQRYFKLGNSKRGFSYSTRAEDYERLCRRCHRVYDGLIS